MTDSVSGARVATVRIRGGSGLGDSLYLRPIVDYYRGMGQPVTVMSDFGDIFMGTGATVERFNRERINITAHYTHGKTNQATTIWQDVCKSAGVVTPLRFTWNRRPGPLLEAVRREADGKPIILVNGGREPFGRRDGFGMDLLPEKRAFAAVLAELDDCLTVRIGKGPEKYGLACDMDLTGATSVAELLDLAVACDGVIGQCSFAIPLAEVFDKPFLLIWSARAPRSRHPFVASIRPAKMLSKPTSRHVADDEPEEKLREAARGFRSVE